MNPFSNNRNAMMHQQSYSAEPYREGMDYTDEAWAYGLRVLPGSLANQLQALGEYTTGKDYPNKLGNYLNELTQVNEMGYTPQTEYEAGVAFLPELVYDPAIIAGAPYAVYKGLRNAPRLANVIADEAGRTTMRNQLGMLAGPNAKNADLAMLAKAQEMKARGVDTDSIYGDTGWWLDHPDGVPRFEIDDSGARFNKSFVDFDQIDADIRVRQQQLESTQEVGREAIAARDMDKYKNEIKPMIDYLEGDIARLKNSYEIGQGQEFGGLGDFLSHYKGYENYPDARDIYTITDPMASGGSFQEKLNQMRIGGRAGQDEAKSTTLHELQHAIQSREGMARGGSPDLYNLEYARAKALDNMMEDYGRSVFGKPLYKKQDELFREAVEKTDGSEKSINDYIEKNLDDILRRDDEYASMEEEYRKLANNGAFIKPLERYKRLAGEADARLVQNRMNMSMDERLANPFYKNYDVPIEEQIIRLDNGTSMSEPLGNLGAFKSQLGAVDLPSGGLDQIQNSIKQKHGLKTLLLSENGDRLDINMIEVPKDKRKSGIGTAAMQDIVDYADSQGKRVYLNPGQADDIHGTTSRNRLVKFYKRFGFVENKGRNKDFTMMGGMYRDPAK